MVPQDRILQRLLELVHDPDCAPHLCEAWAKTVKCRFSPGSQRVETQSRRMGWKPKRS